MSYRRMTKRGLWEIYRRRQAGQSLSQIAVSEIARRFDATLQVWGSWGLRRTA